MPINNLIAIEGTPLGKTEKLDPFEFVRTIAVARITMPKSQVRLSAGREAMDEALQAMCFYAGANSIFYGDRLLTTGNPQADADQALLRRLGMSAEAGQGDAGAARLLHQARPRWLLGIRCAGHQQAAVWLVESKRRRHTCPALGFDPTPAR